jgi:hypothetical protein
MVCCAVILASSQLDAEPFTLGNALTFDRARVREYTHQGTLVQELNVPIPAIGSSHNVVDGVVDSQGDLHVVNLSSGSSFLSSYNSISGAWTHDPLTEYPQPTSLLHVDMGIYSRYLFVGMVRIDLQNHEHVAFSTSVFGGSTSSVGRDGLLYIAQAGHPAYQVAVLDPISLTQLRTLSLFDSNDVRIDVSAITANQVGELFAADLSGVLYHFDANGQSIASVNLAGTQGSPLDIDFTDNGQIVVGYRNDAIMFTDTNLTSFNFISLSELNSPHVAFVQVPVPEPCTFCLCCIGVISGVLGLQTRANRFRFCLRSHNTNPYPRRTLPSRAAY